MRGVALRRGPLLLHPEFKPMTRRIWFAFAALCLLAGVAPVLDGFLPDPLPGLFGLGLRFAILAALFALAGTRRQGCWGGLPVALWGGLLFAALPVVFAAASGTVTGPTRFLVLALIPAGAVFFASQRDAGFGADRSPFALLLPALAGFGGAALLLSYTVPNSTAGKLWLALMAVLAVVCGLALTRLSQALEGTSMLRAGALATASASAVALAFCWLDGHPAFDLSAVTLALGSARLLLFDAPVILLTVWLLPRMEITAFSARYLLAIFVAIAASFLLARPGLSWTVALGALLLLGGSAVLLREGNRAGEIGAL